MQVSVRQLKQPLLLLLVVALGVTGCRSPKDKIVAAQGSASLEGTTLLTALTLKNDGPVPAEDIQIDQITSAGATLTLPSPLPFSVGRLDVDAITTIDANFTLPAVKADTSYEISIDGHYSEDGHSFPFKISETVTTPPASPGQRASLEGTSSVLTASGAKFPAQEPNFGEEVNEGGLGRPIPSGPTRPLTPSATSKFAPPPAGGGGGTASFHMPTDNSQGFKNASSVAEPSGASGGGVVFETANWYASFSVNGGAFTQLNPTTIFPQTDGGFCGDQVVQYVPSIDRFVWVMQYGPQNPAPTPNPNKLPNNGPGLYRIASASPATVKSSGGTSWSYFDITSQQLEGGGQNPWLDYPDTSYGATDFYLSADCINFGGHVVVRIPLAQIKTGGTINWRYTTPSDSNVAWGGHLSQNTGDQVFWAGHNSNSSIRVFNWPENSTNYSWRDISIGTWPQNSSSNPMTSTVPGNINWLGMSGGFPGNAVLGLARSKSNSDKRSLLYLAWTGAVGNGFAQPQVQWIALDINNNFALVSQQQVWNPNYAFAYPAFAVNSQDQIGMSMEAGGGGGYENHVVGFWGDYVLYVTTNSNIGVSRFGDYVTIRNNTADATKFDAFGYGAQSASPNPIGDVHYVVFGR